MAGAIAAAQALPAFLDNAKLNMQVHGGIGFTWEHDAHLFLRRAGTLMALFGGSPAEDVAHLRQTGSPFVVDRWLAVARQDAHRLRATPHQPKDGRRDVELGDGRRLHAPALVRQHDRRVFADPVPAGGGGIGVGIDHGEGDVAVELVIARQQEAGVPRRRPGLVQEGGDLQGRCDVVEHAFGLGRQAEPMGRREIGLGVVPIGHDVAANDAGHQHETGHNRSSAPAHLREPSTAITPTTPASVIDRK